MAVNALFSHLCCTDGNVDAIAVDEQVFGAGEILLQYGMFSFGRKDEIRGMPGCFNDAICPLRASKRKGRDIGFIDKVDRNMIEFFIGFSHPS